MEHGLKQRLIGATVLVSLAVIFVPMLVGEDPQRSEEIQLDIPPYPSDAESKILSLPEKTAEELVTVDIKPEPKISSPVELPQAENKQPAAEELKSWAVQVGSFSSRDNADKFSKQLQKSGYEAFVESARVDNKDTFKVLVGPEISKERALQTSEKLKKDPQISSTWVVHYP